MNDLDNMTKEELRAEIIRLRNGLKKHIQLADDILNNQEMEITQQLINKTRDDLENMAMTTLDQLGKFLENPRQANKELINQATDKFQNKMSDLKEKLSEFVDKVKK